MGELFAVTDPAVLVAIDCLEGHPDWYIRTPVECVLEATGQHVSGEIYLNNCTEDVEVVPSGDFRDVDLVAF